jgi:hypothetical protein
MVASSVRTAQRKRPAPDHAGLQAAERRKQEALAAGYIRSYFSGFEVPPGVDLKSKRYVDLCLDVDICGAVDRAYRCMRACGRMQSTCGDGTMGEDIRLVLRLLRGIRASCIPQEFSAGILLVHLEVLEGIQF